MVLTRSQKPLPTTIGNNQAQREIEYSRGKLAQPFSYLHSAPRHFCLACLVICAFCSIRALRADQVVIREIMYHPPGSGPAWVEIENISATVFDIADWSFSAKDMRFRFPSAASDRPMRTILKPFEHIVLSAVAPDELRTTRSIAPDIRIFGPWEGELKRSNDRLVLEDKNGVIMSQVRYRDGGDWPIAADGAGHSLVLQNIHEPVDDWRNWKASIEPLGTPGLPEAQQNGNPRVLARSFISEVHFSSDGSIDWVEVVHHPGGYNSAETLRLATKRDFFDAVSVPNVGTTGGRVVVDLDFTGEDSKREQTLYLVSSSGRVVDAHAFAIIPSEESLQRWPEESKEWYRGSTPSRGGINQPERYDGIVINEIMYDLPPDSGGAEFIELFNRSEQRINLSGWRFIDGVEFEFPTGTLMEPNAFVVVSADTELFSVAHPDIPVLGEYQGKLANDGERVRLVDAVGNLVSETDYRSGGRWPGNAAGGGSSMELVHPQMEGQLASGWSDSDESAKSEFRTYHHTGGYEELRTLGGVRDYREVHFFMAEGGHVALRNIRLKNVISGEDYISSTARESTNGTGNGGWLIQGNHSASYWDGDVLNLISEGHGDNRANRIEIDVPEMEPGATYELSFEARWISGSARLIAQTWDHSFSYSVRLPIPGGLGTPGRANSRLSKEPVPQLDRLRHSPVVPAPGEPVRISTLVTSIESPSSVVLFHRLDSQTGDAVWRATPMVPESLAPGEATKPSREYTGYLKDYSDSGDVVQFYVRVEGEGGTHQELPANGSDRPSLFVMDDQKLPGDLRTSRFIVSARDLASIAEGGSPEYGYKHPKLSNHYLNGTLISNERDVWYNIEVRRSGSAWNRSETLSRGKWKAPADQLFRGRRKWVFDDDTAGSRRYSDRATRYLLYLLGHPTSENEFVRVIVNAGPAKLREEVEPVDSAFLRRIYPNEEAGELYRVDDEWWFQDSWEPETRDADWSYKGTDDGGRYRTEWMKRTYEVDDDFFGLINLFNVLSAGDYNEATINKLIDANAVLKLAAVSGYIANWDTFTMSRGKNAYFYQRAGDGRFRMFHWDSDAAFERGSGEPFYGEHEPFRTWMEQPYNLRTFTKYLSEIVNEHAEGSARMNTWLEAQNLASPDVAIDIPRFETWFRSRNAFARERFGVALGRDSKLEEAIMNPQKFLPLAGEVFTVDGHTAFLILPQKSESSGKTPWVWYAPTLRGLPGAEEKWMFQKFLDAGIAVAGIDVGESYGSPAGRKLFSALHSHLVRHRGLSQKPCLLARSRGGLMLYNWAVEHPSSVACVAGIYPVCNLISYPGIGNASAAYGMTTEQLEERLSEHNPIDRLKPLAEAQVSIYHLHGDSDTVVPVELNSGELARRYQQLGGEMTLNVIEGQGHNMWSGWFESQELVDFVISNAHKDRPNKTDAGDGK